MRLWICMVLLMLTITGCGTNEQGRIRIRIRNDSDQDITKFWLGAGGPGASTASYGNIPAGSTTSYQSFEPVLANYRKCNFITADGGKYLDTIYPEQHLSAPELSPGSYTFAYTIVNGEAKLALTQDE